MKCNRIKEATDKQNILKRISSPFSSGGGGVRFETQVLTLFVTLMVTGVITPILHYPATKIIPQAKRRGFNTDDIVVIAEDASGEMKLLCCVKCTVAITSQNRDFSEFIESAWYDYNNVSLFQKEKDQIALITNTLSKTDKDLLSLIEFATMQIDTDTFLADLNTESFTSKKKRKKYEVLCNLITKANGGNSPGDKEIHNFIRHIHIMELDFNPNSMFWALTLTQLSQYCDDPKATWGVLRDYVDARKVTGAEITQNLPEELKGYFPKMDTMPSEFLEEQYDDIISDPDNIEALAIMGLIGSWDSRIGRWPGDAEAIREFVNEAYSDGFSEWEKKIKQMRFSEVSPVVFDDGIWTLKDRGLLMKVAVGVFDKTLDAYSKLVLTISSERDPALDLLPNQRFAAIIYGKERKFSPALRESVLEGLAILANNNSILLNCSEDKKNNFSDNTVHSIMKSITWEDICSLNGLMQPIAEASPKIFLKYLEDAINRDPELFLRVQEESDTSFMGKDYLHDVLRALEALAWDPIFLSDVTSLLGSLTKVYGALRGPGPFNSLINIFLPWLPNTTATVEKRIEAVEILRKESPEVAWNLILNLFPGVHTSSSESVKPKWRKDVDIVPRIGVNSKEYWDEYWDQIYQYTSLAVEIGKNDPTKTINLINKMHNMPSDVFDTFINTIIPMY